MTEKKGFDGFDDLISNVDKDIEQVKKTTATESVKPQKSQNLPIPGKTNTTNWRTKAPVRVLRHIASYWILYTILVVIVWNLSTSNSNTSSSLNIPSEKSKPKPQVQSKPAYVRPRTAPNGEPWPVSAGYIRGYERYRTNGLSTVTVDNSQNNTDVFVKLVSLDKENPINARMFFIPANGSFTVNKVTAGNYDIRYRDLHSGHLSRSEQFKLDEIKTNEGTEYSVFTLTLYKVKNGNMQTYGLSEENF